MDGILRRRSMMQAEETTEVWENVSNSATPGHVNWAVSGDSYIATPTSMNWNYRLYATNLKYKWSVAKTARKFRLSFDYSITGLSGTNARLAPSIGTYSDTGGGTRMSFVSGTPIYTDGEGHYVFECEPSDLVSGAALNDNHYLGGTTYAYSSGGTFTIRNYLLEVLF